MACAQKHEVAGNPNHARSFNALSCGQFFLRRNNPTSLRPRRAGSLIGDLSAMKTQILPATEIQSALEVLQEGGLVAFPTDTVYGLGALAFNNHAIESIYTAKDRPIEKAIPVLIGHVDTLDVVAQDIPKMARLFASHFWPGPLTCVVPKKGTLPPAISAISSVAVRIPDHKDALALLRAAGPMAVTSANISGTPSPCTAQQVFEH